MLSILKTVAALAAIGIPFLLLLRLMRRAGRNTGELYGGGWDKYRELKNGWIDSVVRRGGRRRK
jgi:hypothetical protein